MPFQSRSYALFLWLAVSCGGTLLAGCKGGNEAPKGKEGAVPMAPPAESVHALEELTAQAGKLQKTAGELHKRFLALPDDLAGMSSVRSMFYAVEEVVGIEEGKSKWLAGELNAAAASGDKEKLQKVSEQIQGSLQGNKGTEKVLADLSQQLAGFERTVGKQKALAAEGQLFDLTLPSGFQVKGARHGVEESLLTVILDKANKAAKKTAKKPAWFTFDRVVLTNAGSAVDVTESKDQLDNVAGILKAFPAVKVAIAGFTDRSSPDEVARKATSELAEAVKRAMVADGVAAERIEVEGRGSAEPLCAANDTEECKAKNRRIAVRVTAT